MGSFNLVLRERSLFNPLKKDSGGRDACRVRRGGRAGGIGAARPSEEARRAGGRSAPTRQGREKGYEKISDIDLIKQSNLPSRQHRDMKLSTLALLLLNPPLASGEGGIRSAVTSDESDSANVGWPWEKKKDRTSCQCGAGHCDQRACGQGATCGGKPTEVMLSFIHFHFFTSHRPSVE